MGARVTISDLATRLGISKASVSYALNDQPGVSAQTRERVKALAEELGWHRSASALALSAAHTGVVGLVLRRSPELIGVEPYFMRVISGIEDVLTQADYSLLLRLVDHDGEPDLPVFERWAKERRVDGVILFDQRVHDSRAQVLADLGLPAVMHGTASPDSPLPCVANSEESDATTLVDLLAEYHHVLVGHISGPGDLLHEQKRRALVESGCRAAGMTVIQVAADYTWDGGLDAARGLLDRAPNERPTAVIAGNDLMALAALETTRRLGLAVPGDVSVVAWDDSILCRVATPPLTAIDHRPEESGRRTAELLLRLVTEGSAPHRPGPGGRLVQRGSVGPART